jgi:hypothetical protein
LRAVRPQLCHPRLLELLGSRGRWFGAHCGEVEECAMKLTHAQVEEILSQFEASPVPDNHPVIPKLNTLFGEHTFFLAGNGLNIVEPTEASPASVQTGQVIALADWEPNGVDLSVHEPQPIDIFIVLGTKH